MTVVDVPAVVNRPPEIVSAAGPFVSSGIEVTGGPTTVVLLGIVTFLLASLLAVLVTYRFVEGYRRTDSRPVLLLAIGMFFLAPAPMFVRLVTANVDVAPIEVQTLAASLSELTGLLVLLYVVYTT
ncbi:MAG: hypothetical protein ACI9TI_002481 [Natronomonas sp.]|jgi:hypothetical protein|uniref:DUF7521 family protein n=1 Tax=Natronomonas sp. TaxID=2184060 RepID=UPI0039891A6A